jgi:hypothetical protein
MPSSILNSDDGVISGTAGLKSSGGDDGVLVFQSKGTETARINTDKQIVAAAGTASLPVITTTGDLNTGIFFPAADTIAFAEGGAEAMRIDSSGNVGIGTSSPTDRIDITRNSAVNSSGGLTLTNSSTSGYGSALNWNFALNSVAGVNGRIYCEAASSTASYMAFQTTVGSTLAERARIDSSGNLLVGKTTDGFSTAGLRAGSDGRVEIVRSSDVPLIIHRVSNDGQLVAFYQANAEEGNISVSGSTVSYNGGHLSRWAQTTTAKDESLKKGTVLSNLDEMNVYVKPTLYWTEDDELPVDEEGNPTVAVGDVKQETSVSENEQLNKVKVSDVEGDANVAGVFVNWTYDEAHEVDEINMAMTGDMIIRIAEGVTVARGDLLMSAGDGTAKPQGDDIVRSKTIAKVTSTHVTCTYDDGSYCVPCVLMAC